MTIIRIARMRNYGVFQDSSWTGGLSDFGQYNLIHRWNGSGKTTLGGLFRGLKNRAALRRSESDIERLAKKDTFIRLCKGAYLEPPEIAFQRKADVDENYRRLAERPANLLFVAKNLFRP